MAVSTIPKIKSVDEVIVLKAGDDLNNLYGGSASGFYFINDVAANVSNAPVGYSSLIVVGRGSDFGAQICHTKTNFYYRAKSGNPSTWGKWRHLVGTEVT